jgi:2'-5' RNA ligase
MSPPTSTPPSQPSTIRDSSSPSPVSAPSTGGGRRLRFGPESLRRSRWTLNRKIEQALVRAGLEPERRAYSPHITLARLGGTAGSLKPLLERWGGLASPPFAVEEFRLYESRLSPNGAIHTLLERYSLG